MLFKFKVYILHLDWYLHPLLPSWLDYLNLHNKKVTLQWLSIGTTSLSLVASWTYRVKQFPVYFGIFSAVHLLYIFVYSFQTMWCHPWQFYYDVTWFEMNNFIKDQFGKGNLGKSDTERYLIRMWWKTILAPNYVSASE